MKKMFWIGKDLFWTTPAVGFGPVWSGRGPWAGLKSVGLNPWLKFGAAGLLLLFLACIALVWAGQRDKLIKAEVAVVLGNQVYADGRPAPRLAARLDKSVELYRYGYCKTIIVSGGVGKSGVDEATAMAAYLKLKGVPEWNIVVDSQGVNTWHTARFAADYSQKHGLGGVIVVSQPFHIPRAVMAFKKSGCARVGQASPGYWELRDVYSILREMAAIAYYWWRY